MSKLRDALDKEERAIDIAAVGPGFCRGAGGVRLRSAIAPRPRTLFDCARDCAAYGSCRGIAHRWTEPDNPRCVLYYVAAGAGEPAVPSGYVASKEQGDATAITGATGGSRHDTSDHFCFVMSTQ